MEKLIISILDSIEKEMERCHWNAHHSELNSPFRNTGNFYSNDKFIVRAYSWTEANRKPNFESPELRAWWYKHSHRGIAFEMSAEIASSTKALAKFLEECLSAVEESYKTKEQDRGEI